MNMLKRWTQYIGASMALLLVCALILILIMAGANFIQSFSVTVLKDAEWTSEHTVQANFTARTILNFYYILSGVVFLGFFFLMEHQLITTGIPKKLVLRRTFFTVGVELLILALLQGAMMTYTQAVPLQIGLAAVEFLVSVGLIYLGRRKAPLSQA